MAFGDPQDLFKAFPRSSYSAASFGVSRQTIRRARSLVAKSALLVQDRCIKRACHSVEGQQSGVRALKVGWDETSIRLFCDLEKAQRLLPRWISRRKTRVRAARRKPASLPSQVFACKSCSSMCAPRSTVSQGLCRYQQSS